MSKTTEASRVMLRAQWGRGPGGGGWVAAGRGARLAFAAAESEAGGVGVGAGRIGQRHHLRGALRCAAQGGAVGGELRDVQILGSIRPRCAPPPRPRPSAHSFKLGMMLQDRTPAG